MRTRKVNGTDVASLAPQSRNPAIIPPAEFHIKLDTNRSARVTTSKLPGSPNYLYSVYFGDNVHPILERISRPDKDDVITAIAHAHRRKT